MDIKKPFYALIGAGEEAVQAGRSLLDTARGVKPQEVRQRLMVTADTSRKWMTKRYAKWERQGERLATRVGKSAPAKRAAAQTKQARSQVKGAATSVQKAVGAQADAAKSAAKKVG